MTADTLVIVGVGLIGGSAGLGARDRGVARRVVGVGRSAESLAAARRAGCIDDGTPDLAAAARDADLVLVCTPVDRVAEYVRAAAATCRPGTLLTDAGSTKDAIVRALDGGLPPGVPFVGGHPLAGSEKRGPEHARADLFDGRLVILTPTPRTDPAAVERAGAFWRALGARVLHLSPQDHDDALAVTSHLPHLAAAALANTLPEHLRSLTATGFRDTTRVAAGDPDLWAAIFAQNLGAVLAALGRLEERLTDYRHAIEHNDITTLRRLLAEAKAVRDGLDEIPNPKHQIPN
ncbi:MAG TPA: prephenate dehydrogenase/arogenate dehydrogenase family protein [Gemmataceae bacterium]|jgi:prephenate dehydrogenase